MRDSWRARLCLNCEKYIIAARAHNDYCSVSCRPKKKKERDRRRWNAKGNAMRRERRERERRESGKEA